MVLYIRQSRGMFKQIKVCHFCQNENFCSKNYEKMIDFLLTSYYIYTCKILIGKFQNLEKILPEI